MLSRLQPSDIKYIALEGGGGKGNAFVGALLALMDPRVNVLRYRNYRHTNIRGFSGASAGAITSLFLSCGFHPNEIVVITELENFDQFFDRPRAGFGPAIGGCRQRRLPRQGGDPSLSELIMLLLRLFFFSRSPIYLAPIANLQSFRDFTRLIELMREMAARNRRDAEMRFKMAVMAGLVLMLKEELPPVAQTAITNNLAHTVRSIEHEYGIFPGCEIQAFFKRWIAIARWRVRNPGRYRAFEGRAGGMRQALTALRYNALHPGSAIFTELQELENPTFQEHQRDFRVKFAVTGTNLETFKSHIFSTTTTPRFFVADAVRISMSLPLVFKPFILKDDQEINRVKNPNEPLTFINDLTQQREDHYLKGVWVDGGLFNNLPLRVFDNEPGSNPKTLGLRLEYDVRTEINDLFDFFSAWPGKFLLGTGEAHLSRTRNNYESNIILDTDPLGLFSFNPNPTVARAVTERSLEQTLRYFGLTRV